MDLITDAGILKYLQSKEETRSITEVKALSGGSANYVWRATVGSPASDVFDGAKTVVVKHAEEYAANHNQMRLDTIRMHYETRVLRLVNQPGDASSSDEDKYGPIMTERARAPKIYYFDGPNCVVVQEDGGPAPHLKEYISALTQAPSKALSTAIGASLGEFIARLHLYGRQHRDKYFHPDQMDSQMAVGLARLILYDMVPKNIVQHGFLSEDEKAVAVKAAQWGGDRLTNDLETLVHGDFWPGNMLIQTVGDGADAELKRLYVADWELSRYGPAAMDLGQMMAEAITLDRYRQPCVELQTSLLESYCKTYRDHLRPLDLKTAAIHTGCHLLVWSPVTGWFPADDQDKVREVVQLGVELLKHAWNEDWAWFRQHSTYKVMVEALNL